MLQFLKKLKLYRKLVPETVRNIHIIIYISPLNASVCCHIETSQLICCANQLTGFYMRATLTFNGLTSSAKVFLLLEHYITIGSSVKSISGGDFI